MKYIKNLHYKDPSQGKGTEKILKNLGSIPNCTVKSNSKTTFNILFCLLLFLPELNLSGSSIHLGMARD